MTNIPLFLNLAFLAAFIASIPCGIMGSFVVAKRVSSITGSIAHCILGGIGLFEFLRYKYNLVYLDPINGGILSSLIAAFIIGWVHIKYKQKEDAAIAMIWSCGMAIGIIFLSLIPDKHATCTHFLFGDIFTTNQKDIYLLAILALAVIVLTTIFYRKFLIICFDEELAYLQKIHTKLFYFLLLSMISLSIVLLIKIVGIILIIALLTIPATIAMFFTHKFPLIILISVFLCLIFNFSGIYISYLVSWPPGATIAIIACIFYIILLLIKKLIYIND